MCLFIEITVLSGLVTACLFATWPIKRSPAFVKPTIDGVVRAPSGLGITTASPPSITDTHEFVVPKSIPIIFDIKIPPKYLFLNLALNLNHCGSY